MYEVLAHLDRLNIRIFALSIADAGEFGLVRLIVSDAEEASKILEEDDFNLAKSRKNTEVTAILIREKEKISKFTKILSDNGINIDYAYTSTIQVDGKLALILRVSDTERAEKILRENDVMILSLDELKSRFR
jgi:hypothetical protein